MLVTSAFGAVKHNSGGAFADVAAVKYQSGSTFANVTPKSYSGEAWYALIEYGAEWILVVGMGQSNLVGNPPPDIDGYGEYPTVTVAGAEYKTIAGTITYPIVEPTGNGDPPFDYSGQDSGGGVNGTGSMWPAFVNKYHDLTGKKVMVLSLGANGTMTSQWIADYLPMVKTRIDACLVYLTAQGYDFVFEDIIWIQGESDNYAGVSQATYYDNLETIFDYFVTQYPSYVLHFNIGYPHYGTFYGTPNAQPAQLALASDRADVTLASSLQYSGPGGWHFTQNQYNTIGEAIAVSMDGRK